MLRIWPQSGRQMYIRQPKHVTSVMTLEGVGEYRDIIRQKRV